MFAPGNGMPTSQFDEIDALTWAVGGVNEAVQAGQLSTRAFDPHFRETWTESQMAGLLATPGAWLEMGSVHGGPIAFALCRQIQDEVELLLCAISPDLRRRGLGRQLVAQVAARARERGASRVFLEVRSSNEPAINLYIASGFTRIGTRPDYYRTMAGERIDAITLALLL